VGLHLAMAQIGLVRLEQLVKVAQAAIRMPVRRILRVVAVEARQPLAVMVRGQLPGRVALELHRRFPALQLPMLAVVVVERTTEAQRAQVAQVVAGQVRTTLP
jgi:hypothetical protein